MTEIDRKNTIELLLGEELILKPDGLSSTVFFFFFFFFFLSNMKLVKNEVYTTDRVDSVCCVQLLFLDLFIEFRN